MRNLVTVGLVITIAAVIVALWSRPIVHATSPAPTALISPMDMMKSAKDLPILDVQDPF